MFIPGFGAIVRLKQHPASPVEDAQIGLAGPLWGLAAALVAYAVFLATHHPFWSAIAHLGAWINLFNLLPVWQLDGGRGFHALSRKQAWWLVLVIATMWYIASEMMLLILLILAIARAATKPPASPGHRPTFLLFAALVILLSLLILGNAQQA